MHNINPDGGGLGLRCGPIKVEAHIVACGLSTNGQDHAGAMLHNQRRPLQSSISCYEVRKEQELARDIIHEAATPLYALPPCFVEIHISPPMLGHPQGDIL